MKFTCGTFGSRLKALDKTYGDFKVIKDLGTKEFKTKFDNIVNHRRAVFLCPYGDHHFEATVDNIKRGLVRKSCGCHKYRHGEEQTVLYSRWLSMKGRCYNKNKSDYYNYGGNGVTVCNAWKHNFNNFKDWAHSNGFREDLVIDKDELCDELGIYPKIYSPETCQWVTQSYNNSYTSSKRRSNG